MPGGPRGLQNRRRFVLRVEVGSIPTLSATFIEENERLEKADTDLAQKPAESGKRKVKFPQVIKHRKAEATIYGKSAQYPRYRLAYYVAGQRRLRTFATYGDAKAEADRIVRDLAGGSQATALTGSQSRDALAALERLEANRQATGKRFSLLAAVSEFSEVIALLNGRPLRVAVDGFLTTVADVKRKDLAEAVTEFTASREPKTKPKRTGERAALNSKYVENTRNWLKAFAEMFPGYCVCDLTKDHLDAYVATMTELSPKSRNHRRAIAKQFLRWCVAKDYLSQSHRLFEATEFHPEELIGAKIDYYLPDEFRALLENAEPEMRVIIALQGLAGLRLEEALRLEFTDLFRRIGHIEITSAKSKTRQHRLVKMVPALQQWLEPFQGMEGRLITTWTRPNSYDRAFRALRESLKIPSRKNGLRHAFCTYHFALHCNENLTAAQAGNSPAMIHAHYKGLATKAEAEKWFNVTPAKAENVILLSATKD